MNLKQEIKSVYQWLQANGLAVNNNETINQFYVILQFTQRVNNIQWNKL